MDIAAITSQNTAMAQTQLSEAVSNTVLRKALDIEAQSAQQLLQALPPVASNPPNLGNRIDVKA